MKDHIAKLLRLIGRERTTVWVVLVALAVGVGVVELIGALLIFVLLTAITGPASGLEVPIVGDVRARFPDVSDETFLLWMAGIVAGFFILRGGVILLQSYLQHRLAQNAGARLAARLLRGYLDMPYAFHLRRNSSEFIRNTHHSVAQIVLLAFIPVVVLTSQALLVIALFIALLVASTTATLVTIAVMGPIVFLLFRSLKRTMRRVGTVHQETAKATFQALQESFQGVRDIKVLGRERFFEWRFAESRAEMARAAYVRGALTEIPHVATETMLVIFIVAFLVIAIATDRPLGDLLAVLGTFGYVGMRLIPSLNRIVSSANNLQFAKPAVDDVSAELVLFDAHAHVPTELGAVTFERELVVDDLVFEYEGGESVLNGISFSVTPGESIGIVGSTGAGKSTLVDIMLGLLTPTSGSVTSDGVSIHAARRAWQARLGVVPQATFLIDDTLMRNIAFGLGDEEIDSDRVETTVHLAQLTNFVATLPEGLQTIVGERGVRLSGGQRQRVAIARALFRDPMILFFDEATSALDNVTETRLIEGLENLRGRHTIVMVAHRLSTVRKADRILLLEEGRVVDSGTYDDLMQRSALFQAMAR